MKKCIRLLFVSVIILALTVCVLTACNDGQTQNTSAYAGKYYKYSNGEKNPSSYIELKSDGKWFDGDDSGTYSVKDGKISIMQDKEELMSGTISNGVMVLEFWGMKTTYKKDGASGTQGDGDHSGNDNPPPANEYTVTFYLNYGTNSEEKKQTSDRKITYLPTRDGYTFNGWWTISGFDSNNDPILNKRWNMSDEVKNDDLVLYADWYETVEDGQLRQPSVVVDGYDFSWQSIANSNGYNVKVTKGNEEISSVNVTSTSWSFNQSLECGVYTVSIRANGNGVNSTNSTYTVKTVRHKVLDSFESFTYNKNDETIQWSSVENATEYALDIDHLAQDIASDVFSYSVANLDAGNHTLTIYAKREGWLTSSRSLSFKKEKLKTPDDIRASYNKETNEYEIVWSSVKYADSYKIYIGNSLVDTVETPSYKIDAIDWNNSWETSKTIKVISYDSEANYLQSTYSQPLVLQRMATVSVEANDENAGEVSAEVNMADSITVTFDYNYKGCPKPLVQTLTADSKFEYPIPTRAGYTFSGWFEDAKLSRRYDFSKGIGMDTTLYAAWYGIELDQFNLNQQYSISTSTTTKSYSFISYINGSYTLYYRNGSSGRRTDIYVTEDGQRIYSPGYQTNSSNKTFTFDVKVGKIYKFGFTAYSSSYTGSFYFEIQGKRTPDCPILADVQEGNTLQTEVGKTITMTAETNPGYTFLGWYNGGAKVSDELTYSTQVKVNGNNYIARWTSYIVHLSSTEGGTTSISTGIQEAGGNGKSYKVSKEETVTITASTNVGYTWLGWYEGDTKVSEGTSFNYTFAMPSANKTYTAKWCKVTLNTNVPSAGSISPLSGKYVPGDQATAMIYFTSDSGYTWLGWYDGETKVSEGTSLSYTFTMSSEDKTYIAKWMECPITLEKNIDEAGSISGLSTTKLGEQTTVTALTNDGYTWLGWYDGETKVSEGASLSYTFTLLNENKIYTAKWMECPVTLGKNIEYAGTVSGLSNSKLGEEITISASTNAGYTWLGWYEGDEKVSEGINLNYTFILSEKNIRYEARWQITYIDASRKTQIIDDGNDVVLWQSGDNSCLTGWYLFSGTTSLNFSFAVSGVAYVILADNCNWTINGGIIVEDGNELYIYAQSENENMGHLFSTTIGGKHGTMGNKGSNGISLAYPDDLSIANGGAGKRGSDGGDSGTITICGGYITATMIGGGIGGTGGTGGSSGKTTNATGHLCGAGGNGGTGGNGGIGNVIINGGVVTATVIGGGIGGAGGSGAPGYSDNAGGYGKGGAGGLGGTGGNGGIGNVIINGGLVIATAIGGGIGGTGGNGAIGGSAQGGMSRSGNGGNGGKGGNGNTGIITINGGTVIATIIGGGMEGAGGKGGASGEATYNADRGYSGSVGGHGVANKNGTAIIVGGSVNANIQGSITNGGDFGNQELKCICIETTICDVHVDDIKISDIDYYNISGIKTDSDGRLFIWLPNRESKITVIIDNQEFINDSTNTLRIT